MTFQEKSSSSVAAEKSDTKGDEKWTGAKFIEMYDLSQTLITTFKDEKDKLEHWERFAALYTQAESLGKLPSQTSSTLQLCTPAELRKRWQMDKKSDVNNNDMTRLLRVQRILQGVW